MVCVCDHQDDEHDWQHSAGPCTIENCPCIAFEAAEGEGEIDD